MAVARERAKTIGKDSPAIERKAMLVARCRGNDTAQTICLQDPATGHDHRFPLDCWRIFADGFRALARYSHLEVLHAHTHWKELARYDSESNKWHESILVARKRPQSLGKKIRQRLFAAARR